MRVLYTTDRERYKRMTTEELRESYLLEDLFTEGQINLVYNEVERAIAGGAVPLKKPVELEAGKELASEYFCQRRELGILNIGGKGSVEVDSTLYAMENLDCLYVGKGSKRIIFSSDDAKNPAKFYLLSYPAHQQYPTTHASKESATPLNLGSMEESNKRTIFKYIYPDGIKSCQLVMGFTVLEAGSVWNTMPAHTHERRTEVYAYFNLPENGFVFHLMGMGNETRHIAVREAQAVVSPMWSIHSGIGTGAYSFCWGMGGENQDFNDMDHIEMDEIF